MNKLMPVGIVACAVLLVACGEKPQAAATKKVDDQPWQGAAGGQVVADWKVGDKASWEAQLTTRSQRGQNEYTRAAAQP